MEVVVRRVHAHARVALADRNVIEAPPFEEDAAARERELLDDAADDDAVAKPAEARQVRRHRLPGGDERRAVRRQHELVEVGMAADPSAVRKKSCRLTG